MNFLKICFRSKPVDVSMYPDAHSSSWTDLENAFDLNQEVGRWIFFFSEWAGYDWECGYYDAG